MTVSTFIWIVFVIGLVLVLFYHYVRMDARIKRFLVTVAIVFLLIWALYLFGLAA